MGMRFDFYTGDTDAVMKMLATISQGQDVAHDSALTHAEFTLNLQRQNLDRLSQLLHGAIHQDPVRLFAAIEDDLDAGPGQQYGIHLLRGDWVATVASLADNQVDELASQWFRSIGEESGLPQRPTWPAIKAIKELLAVCRKAVAGEMPVVFCWSE